MCIARSNKGLNSNFTVRKISYGEGVERVFPLYAPTIAEITVIRRGDVRRAKLYYLRGRRGKSARIAEKARAIVGTTEAAAGGEPRRRIEDGAPAVAAARAFLTAATAPALRRPCSKAARVCDMHSPEVTVPSRRAQRSGECPESRRCRAIGSCQPRSLADTRGRPGAESDRLRTFSPYQASLPLTLGKLHGSACGSASFVRTIALKARCHRSVVLTPGTHSGIANRFGILNVSQIASFSRNRGRRQQNVITSRYWPTLNNRVCPSRSVW